MSGRSARNQSNPPDTGRDLPPLGLLEWIHFGDYDRAERVLQDLRELNAAYLRTGFSWADYHRPEGPDWFEWLYGRLSEHVEILPCFVFTPPSIARRGHIASPPRDLDAFAGFFDEVLDRYGRYFTHVELWNEGNNHHYWDWYDDPEWKDFAGMITPAARLARERGFRTVLGGMSPTDPPWLWTLGTYGVLDHIDVVGVHGFPDTWDDRWLEWEDTLGTVRETLRHGGWDRPLWITEAGYSTWRHDEHRQVLEFVRAMDSRVERVYWYSAHDLHPDRVSDSGFHRDERHYHFGLRTADGVPKLLWRLLADNDTSAIRKVAAHAERVPAMPQPPDPTPNVSGDGASADGDVRLRIDQRTRAGVADHRLVVITGGAGFVGTNLAARLLLDGRRVRVFDSLHRPGVLANLEWLTETFGDALEVELGDVRNSFAVRHALRDATAVFHFAAQVAVTTSLSRPRQDFGVNVEGMVNLLEAVRALPEPPPVLFTSTNKVYGDLGGLPLRELDTRYQPQDPSLAVRGIGETQPLTFHSPYGCSKGAADQYGLDYARSYGLRAVVFRMSCIYGPHQFGNEDQGWLAHFLIRALRGEPITIFGDGKQVRDALYVGDLVEAMLAALQNIDRTSGRAFNIGGGPENATSLLELLDRIGTLTGEAPERAFAPWRTGDQPYYVSDLAAIRNATGWQPRVALDDGLHSLHDWLLEHHPHVSGEPAR